VVADEVQTGLGRLGNMWGFKAQALEHVDFVTMGKPVANGFPLGVVVTNRELLNRFSHEIDLFSTFGGNPVACAAGMALLDEIELMKEECVLVSEAGPKNVFKIRPNFSWEREHVDLFVTTLDRCLSKL
jgi:4-aminobutyrate aminotransferase-like enzyme